MPMNEDQALQFLRKHQPMPTERELTQRLLQDYDDARIALLESEDPPPEAVPLILGSFGEGSGGGIYQLMEDVVLRFSHEEVIPHLLYALNNNPQSSQYWTAQVSSNFPDKRLISTLFRLYDTGDFDLKYAALSSLGQIESPEVARGIERRTATESDPEIKELLIDILSRY